VRAPREDAAVREGAHRRRGEEGERVREREGREPFFVCLFQGDLDLDFFFPRTYIGDQKSKSPQVVLGVVDPNPLVAGGGVSLLRAAGIEVAAIDGAEAEEAAGLNPEFMRRMREGAAAAAAAAAAKKKKRKKKKKKS
jgi:hypothetical protein